MNIDSSVYSEVYEILSHMPKATVMKIPEEILKNIIEKRDPNYVSRIDYDNLYDYHNVDRRTCAILTWLNLEYIASPEEKVKINGILRKNELEKERKKSEEYAQNFEKDIFKNYEENEEKSDDIKESYLMPITKKESFLKRILNKILSGENKKYGI